VTAGSGPARRAALVVGTVFGAGYAPLAPGTLGSAVGVVLYYFTARWPLGLQLTLLAGVTVVGIWSAGVVARHLGREDPGQVVVDEVAGQLVTFIGAGTTPAALAIVIGFLAFRAFDIVKPWPVNRLERLPGGLGIMADDLMAGVYAAIVLRLAVYALGRIV
jgi:phosphatidylglycerophosphatase A